VPDEEQKNCWKNRVHCVHYPFVCHLCLKEKVMVEAKAKVKKAIAEKVIIEGEGE
jgi:hypothetical protein